jgi:hypothetical protein
MQTPVFIHVGFSNTGTTSLQRNFFATRDDIFLAGEPYGERGGIFTAIKSVEDFKFDTRYMESLCRDLIHAKNSGRSVVISDETLSDTPQLYFAPYMMPRDVIALRLHHLFPSAKVIFTVRDQREYAASMYLNLKRNAAFFDRMPMMPFADWLAETLAGVRPHYLQNLDFTETINLYRRIFGRENICVLPLEIITTDGVRAYLSRLCDFLRLQVREQDIRNYSHIQNRRMSVRRELVAELLQDDRFSRLYADLIADIGRERVDAYLDDGPRASVAMAAGDEQKIRRRVGVGNWVLAREFDLDLSRYGYPMADDGEFSDPQLALAKQEIRFQIDIDRLDRAPQSEKASEIRRSAEIAAIQSQLRELSMEFATVSRSPVWRTVKRLDRARRMLSRAAAVALNLL